MPRAPASPGDMLPQRPQHKRGGANAVKRVQVDFAGGTAHWPNNHLVGGHVDAFALHSRRRDVGFDCLD